MRSLFTSVGVFAQSPMFIGTRTALYKAAYRFAKAASHFAASTQRIRDLANASAAPLIERFRIHWENTFHFCARAPVAEPYAASRLTGTRARTCLKRKGFQHIASQVCVCGEYV
jgi:hypothetical protein